MTELQRAFIRSNLLKHFIQAYCFCNEEQARTIRQAIAEPYIRTHSEAYIRAFLYMSMHAADVPIAEKREARRLLSLSVTTFTAEQAENLRQFWYRGF